LAGDRDQGVVAFVLLDEKYLDGVLELSEAENNQIRKWRKSYDLSQLTKDAAAAPFAFNTAGWNSSYTRQLIPPDDMREWVQTTVERISSLGLTEVLEIGCGTGLLLLRLAPACQRYVGVDFSASVLMRLREQLVQREDIREKVDLLERSAANFDGFAENSFSTVILNSVAQHFPSQAYLNRVMENAIRVVKPGGHLFVGDQRSLPLLEAYALSVEAFEAPPTLPAAELRSRVYKRVQHEQQLVPSPSYFLSLKQRLPKVSRVQIFPRRGVRDNEMTRFRYDAILSIGSDSAQTTRIPFLDPPARGWGLDEMRSLLVARSSQAVGFARVGNSRVEKDVQLLSRLASTDPATVLGELRNGIDQAELHGIHPEAIFRIAVEAGHDVALSWAGCDPNGSYDAAFVRKSSPNYKISTVEWPQPVPADFVLFTNAPGQVEIRRKLLSELVSHCQSRLGNELVPGTLYVVDSIPHKTDGNVDCEALLTATGRPLRHFRS
jgi:SAM-dependent methyltransferase